MNQTLTLSAVPTSAHGYVAAKLALSSGKAIIHIAANDRQLEQTALIAAQCAPELRVLALPAWDCLPYDRVSPVAAITAQRLATLSALAQWDGSGPLLLITTLSAAMQYLPPKAELKDASFELRAGSPCPHDQLINYLAHHGYSRVCKVIEPGEFAVRGSLIDLFPPGHDDALRLDLFGDDLESLRRFDPLSQISHDHVDALTLHPMNEILLNDDSIERFRTGYRERFGAITKSDPLYEAISAGRHAVGMEHWLPLFYEHCDSLFDYLPNAIISFDDSIHSIYDDRLELLQDYYQARRDAPADAGAPYHPIEPKSLYLFRDAWEAAIAKHYQQICSSMARPNADDGHGVSAAPSFAAKQAEAAATPFIKLKERFAINRDKPVIIAAYSTGSAERMMKMASEQGLKVARSENLSDATRDLHIIVLPIEHGFEGPSFLLLSEQDLLGERVIRTEKRKRAAEAFLADAAALSAGELIVHQDHGVGRFDGLVTLDAGGAQHDCLKLVYADEAKLFLPVVNMELISRFGGEGEQVQLDKLGAASWQKRKAAMKQRIKLAAEQLLKIAARRATRQAPECNPNAQSYAEFSARFTYSETEDQQRAIDAVLSDLTSGTPMDRLICGDVGFGKTEVALRAAFTAAAGESPVQVALVAPTTLLARQHYQTFKSRFEGFGLEVRLLSRLVSSKAQREVKEGLKSGHVDIVIGTHALLAKSIEFERLGLVIVDEEQRFGVAHKERLKQLRANIHVLTLSATPIPRTLQMALVGVRELSLITTPPVDRLAVRSFVMPYDGVVIKEALMREFHRGGQVFYVTPRIEHLHELEKRLRELVPEMRIGVAHGQMAASELETRMQAFYDGEVDILLSTTIVESGLDVPKANTIIIDRAHQFGLAQLYQLRGRVGRGKTRAYAYLTLPSRQKLTEPAQKRLEVMSQLDTLGAGFTLASHDMDIRGFGNLLGEEQSGHVREVGVELYQHMLEETIRALKAGDDEDAATDDWSPTINLGASMLIPESYVEALDVRMQLYRRSARLEDEAEIESFAAEMVDRFGPLPEEAQELIRTLHLKRICKRAGIERIDTGPKGAIISFRGNAFAKPEALLRHITQQPKQFKIRADQKLVYQFQANRAEAKIDEVHRAAEAIATLAA